jgi:hypothetical protein
LFFSFSFLLPCGIFFLKAYVRVNFFSLALCIKTQLIIFNVQQQQNYMFYFIFYFNKKVNSVLNCCPNACPLFVSATVSIEAEDMIRNSVASLNKRNLITIRTIQKTRPAFQANFILLPHESKLETMRRLEEVGRGSVVFFTPLFLV